MAVLTRSDKPLPNGRARASVVAGLVAVAAVPAGIVVAESVDELRLLHATVSVPVGAAIGLLAIALARRARGRIQLTLGRVGGERTAWVGRALGLLGIYLAATAGLAVAFYGLLELFAS